MITDEPAIIVSNDTHIGPRLVEDLRLYPQTRLIPEGRCWVTTDVRSRSARMSRLVEVPQQLAKSSHVPVRDDVERALFDRGAPRPEAVLPTALAATRSQLSCLRTRPPLLHDGRFDRITVRSDGVG